MFEELNFISYNECSLEILDHDDAEPEAEPNKKLTKGVKKALFEKELLTFFKDPRSTLDRWTIHRIHNIIKIIESTSGNGEYNGVFQKDLEIYSRNFEILKVNEEKILIKKRKSPNDPIVSVIPNYEYHSVLREAHTVTDHGNSQKMISFLKRKYWIPFPIIVIFCRLCKVCQKRNKLNLSSKIPQNKSHLPSNKDDELEQILQDRGMVEFIDMQHMPDGEYKWILLYQDLNTFISILRPLTSKNVDATAKELLKIILQYGCPSVLMSSLEDRELISKVLNKIKKFLPMCQILLGSGSGKDQEKPTVEEMLKVWCDRYSAEWTKWVHFIQHQRNSSIPPEQKKITYTSLFKIAKALNCPKPNVLVTGITTEQRAKRKGGIPKNKRHIRQTLQTQNNNAGSTDQNTIVLSSDDDSNDVRIDRDERQEVEIEVIVDGDLVSKRIKIEI